MSETEKHYELVYMVTPLESNMDARSALSEQVGGNHYKDMAIQPVEFCMANNLNFCQSSVVEYICRYKNKNGIEDLRKAKHFIDLLIELEYENTK